MQPTMRRSLRLKQKAPSQNSQQEENQDGEWPKRDLEYLTKEMVLLLLRNRKKWVSVAKIAESFEGMADLALQVIYVFEGLGLVDLIGRRWVVFLGTKGAIQKLVEFIFRKIETSKIENSKSAKAEFVK